jgi:rhodanese-related sulfurtransferase/rubrerythrin
MEPQAPDAKLLILYADKLDEYRRGCSESDYMLVDVREPVEYETGHIPGALLMPLGEVELHLDELDPGRELIFYCRSGNRSRAASMLALGSGRFQRPVYNLEGGFSAWTGKSLEDFPRVKLFEDIKDPREILLAAMEMEKGAWRFYKALSDEFGDTPFKAVADELVQLERKHAQVVYDFLERYGPQPTFDELFENMAGDILEGGESVEGAVERARSSFEVESLSFAEMALDIEYRAYDLYRNLFESAANAEDRQVFSSLAEQEKGHVRVIARHVGEYVSPS